MPSTLRHCRTAMRALCAAPFALLAGIVPAATAATPAIYKCFDRNLGILYTDQPCSGEQIDVRPGQADPEAVAALQRERDALSRSIEQRITDQRRAAPERNNTAPAPYAGDGGDAKSAGADVYYPAGFASGFYGHGSAPRARPDRARHNAPSERNRYVPNPPRGLPR